MPQTLITILIIALFIWLFLLTIAFWRMLVHYNRLSQGAGEKGLRALLDSLIEEVGKNKKDIEMLREYCDRIEKEGQLHIQKVGLLRFNPFKDTGGDQSFILSLLDKSDTGILISGLYSRSGLRWYAKRVINGRGAEHELSEEEKKALRQAGEIGKS